MNQSGPHVRWIDPHAPPDEFPDPAAALREPNGLLAIGGDLSVERLLAAYRRGIFPWFSDGQPILWWTPDPRAVLFPAEFRMSRSLRKTLRKNTYRLSVDQAFRAVVAGCATRGAPAEADVGGHNEDPNDGENGTWITRDMATAYEQLHTAGHAHSIETWCDGQLVGGLYGINIGHVFFGESMFSCSADASKAAFVKLISICRATGIELIDCQVASGHLTRLGSREIARADFNRLLAQLTTFPSVPSWPDDSIASKQLVE